MTRQGRAFQTGNCREMPAVAAVGCIRSSVTVSGNKNATSSSAVLLPRACFPPFCREQKEKGAREAVGVEFAPEMPEARQRPALAPHTALNILHLPPAAVDHSVPDHPHRTSLSHPAAHLPPPWEPLSQPSVGCSESAVHASLITHLTIALRVFTSQHTAGDCKTRKICWR